MEPIPSYIHDWQVRDTPLDNDIVIENSAGDNYHFTPENAIELAIRILQLAKERVK